MNFEFSDDQLVMKEEVRKLFEKEDSVKRNRNILEGDENFDKDYKNYPCKCGSKNCAGFIVKSESRWRIKKSKKNKSINR